MTTDYARLIDAETWAFINRINAFYPPETANLPIERNREIYDRMSRAFHTAYPAGVSAQAGTVPLADHDVALRIYRKAGGPEAAVVLYFHGGGFILGGLDSHDDICADICAGTGAIVISVDYRLAPEHPGAAAFDDAVAAFEWVGANYPQPIVLVGESAGGNLAACVAHHTRGHALAAIGQVLIYPGLGGDEGQGSYVTHAEAPMLSTRDLDFYRAVRTGEANVSDDPRYTPLADNDFSELPPTVIFTAQCDPLSSDGEAYRDRLLRGGGKARWQEEEALPHGYLRARHTVGRARASFARIVEAIGMLG
ncbi:MAG TPA: alpha/beta hydrolase, partial [Mesorhizobium sp.]